MGHSLPFPFLPLQVFQQRFSLTELSPRQHSPLNAHNKPVFIAGRIISTWFCHPALSSWSCHIILLLQWLDSMILKIFSNLNSPVIPWFSFYCFCLFTHRSAGWSQAMNLVQHTKDRIPSEENHYPLAITFCSTVLECSSIFPIPVFQVNDTQTLQARSWSITREKGDKCLCNYQNLLSFSKKPKVEDEDKNKTW